ncbi:unnamed protein product [Protopolystoma xenopodis]|uniref:Uncharacterized protein n=1 Tax=Protopolystoma xenopodis TaxID=117903 RepID=A0A448XL49_9PLAT|nr:unnamed protein product [Protopolystoma xenopodis]
MVFFYIKTIIFHFFIDLNFTASLSLQILHEPAREFHSKSYKPEFATNEFDYAHVTSLFLITLVLGFCALRRRRGDQTQAVFRPGLSWAPLLGTEALSATVGLFFKVGS